MTRSTSLTFLLTSTLSLISHAALAADPPTQTGLITSRTLETEAGQAGGGTVVPAQATNRTTDEDRDDRSINLAQPDYTVIDLPTTLRLPRRKGAFRVTHRFGRPLGQGTFGDLASDLFSIDSGALIGLEYRYGIMRGTQIGIYRTTDKTIEFFGQYDAIRQGERRPVTVDALVSVEGTNNFGASAERSVGARHEYSPALGAIVSRTVGTHAAVYLEPIWVGHSNLFSPTDPHDNTFIVGLGARLRVRPSVYVVGAWTPRAAGYHPGVSLKTFGIEKRLGGHSFQLNFSNSLGTTLGQMARGGGNHRDWFMGFNISRKFY